MQMKQQINFAQIRGNNNQNNPRLPFNFVTPRFTSPQINNQQMNVQINNYNQMNKVIQNQLSLTQMENYQLSQPNNRRVDPSQNRLTNIPTFVRQVSAQNLDRVNDKKGIMVTIPGINQFSNKEGIVNPVQTNDPRYSIPLNQKKLDLNKLQQISNVQINNNIVGNKTPNNLQSFTKQNFFHEPLNTNKNMLSNQNPHQFLTNPQIRGNFQGPLINLDPRKNIEANMENEKWIRPAMPTSQGLFVLPTNLQNLQNHQAFDLSNKNKDPNQIRGNILLAPSLNVNSSVPKNVKKTEESEVIHKPSKDETNKTDKQNKKKTVSELIVEDFHKNQANAIKKNLLNCADIISKDKEDTKDDLKIKVNKFNQDYQLDMISQQKPTRSLTPGPISANLLSKNSTNKEGENKMKEEKSRFEDEKNRNININARKFEKSRTVNEKVFPQQQNLFAPTSDLINKQPYGIPQGQYLFQNFPQTNFMNPRYVANLQIDPRNVSKQNMIQNNFIQPQMPQQQFLVNRMQPMQYRTSVNAAQTRSRIS